MLYFGYGANTNHRQMAARCPGARFLGQALLPDHRLLFRGVADVTEAIGQHVQGALWDVTPEHLSALDRFEGYPTLYIRTNLRIIPTRLDVPHRAIIYRMQPGYRPSLPSKSYLETLIEGYLDCGLSREQLEAACQFSASSDAAQGYASKQWARPQHQTERLH